MKPSAQLTTQCPQCGGRFAVGLTQLQLRKGLVRCVYCAHIFDGYETVVPEGDGAESVPSAPSAAVSLPAVIRQRRAPSLQTDAAHVPDDAFSISDPAPVPAPEQPEDHPGWHLGAYDAGNAADAPVAGIYAERRTPPAPAGLPDFLDDAPGRDWALWAWAVLCVLALVLGLTQAAVIYRVQLASDFPRTRPALERLCGALGCRVEYPKLIDKITIQRSALRMQSRADQRTSQRTDQANDANSHSTHLILHVTLRNVDGRAQQWPSLLLDLTDFSGATVIRKRLHSADYLPAALHGQPFGGESELALRLPMRVQGVAVSGYQLKPFFP